MSKRALQLGQLELLAEGVVADHMLDMRPKLRLGSAVLVATGPMPEPTDHTRGEMLRN